MAQAQRSQPNESRGAREPQQGGAERSMQLIDLTLRSWGQLYDLQMSAARMMLRTQSRAAMAIGLPDWSGLFESADERARNLFSVGAEQWVSSARRTQDAVAELQREVGRMIDTETATVAQTLRQGFTQLGDQASEGFTELVQKVREGADEAERMAVAANQEMANGQREGESQQRESRRRAA
jgi:hypothetical protein